MTQQALATLKTFRQAIYERFHQRADACMNLLDALSSHAHRCRSVVELSEAPCFERQYSSITDAIADGLAEQDWKALRKVIYQTSFKQPHPIANLPCFVLDCTSNARPHAKRLTDRSIVHTPNPAPGNKPIAVGHQYSCIVGLPSDEAALERHWVLPISAHRVKTTEKGHEVGMRQLSEHIEEAELSDEVTVSIGDSLYGTDVCRHLASQQPNLVHIFRLNCSRNVFCPPEETEHNKGRSKEFGKKVSLQKPEDMPAPHESTTLTRYNNRGQPQTVTIKCWKNMLLRGSRQYQAGKHPLNLIQVTITRDDGTPVFKRPLWVAILGQHRDKITPEQAYELYIHRSDIEQYFRFSKKNLLMNEYQTPETPHEETWYNLCMLAYYQLYLANTLGEAVPKPWEKYLPSFTQDSDTSQSTLNPSQTQRAMINLLQTVGTPANPCVPRGRNSGRKPGASPGKREHQPIVFKTKVTQKTDVPEATASILAENEKPAEISDTQTIDTLFERMLDELKKRNISPEEFAKYLLNTS